MDNFFYKYKKYKAKYTQLKFKGGAPKTHKDMSLVMLRKYLKLAKQNGHLELLYQITEKAAAVDGLDESYITPEYNKKIFNNEVKQIEHWEILEKEWKYNFKKFKEEFKKWEEDVNHNPKFEGSQMPEIKYNWGNGGSYLITGGLPIYKVLIDSKIL